MLIWLLSTSTFLIVHRSFFDDEHVLFQAKPSAAVSGAPLEKPIMLIKARDEGGKPGSTPDAAPPVSGSGAAKLEREGQRPTQPVYQIQNRGMASTASTCAVDRELFSDAFFFFLLSVTQLTQGGFLFCYRHAVCFPARHITNPINICIHFSLPAVIGQTKLLPPEKMKHSIKLVDDQMNWCDSAMEVRVH